VRVCVYDLSRGRCSVEDGVRHSSGESEEESPEDEEDGEELGDGGATCMREASTVKTSEVAGTTAVVAAGGTW
jgi:hypothetical protein